MGFVADDLVAQLTGGLVHSIGVGRHATVDDRRTQSVGGVDDDLPRITRERIGREENPGDLGRNHGLNHDSDGDRDVLTKRAQVRKHAGAKETRPADLDGVEDLVFAHQVEQSRVHPRGGSALLIFVRGRRTNGKAGSALVGHRE